MKVLTCPHGSCFDYTARGKCRWVPSFVLGVRNEKTKRQKQNPKPQEIIKAWSQKMSSFEGVNRSEVFQPWEVCTSGMLDPNLVSVAMINTRTKAKWGGRGWFHLNSHNTVVTSKNSSHSPEAGTGAEASGEHCLLAYIAWVSRWQKLLAQVGLWLLPVSSLCSCLRHQPGNLVPTDLDAGSLPPFTNV